ncbi:MAG TPA: V-type ATP synthase subunit I [Candidatus Binatia bacterium]|nr:V-type ATP synthase subunit I [Candidatus Binatia bacterium]
MSIVRLVKVTLYGPSAEKDAVLDELQALGCVHLNDLGRRAEETRDAGPASADAHTAWRYLEDSPVRRRPLADAGDVDLAAVVREASEIRDRSHALGEEREQLRKAIAERAPWGDFDLPEWAREGATHFWFYVIPLHQLDRMERTSLAWRVVARDHRFAYVVVVAPEPPADMPVAPLALDPRSLSALRARFAEVERELEELDYRRIGLTLYRDLLREWLDEADDRAERERAGRLVAERDEVFAVQGWAPQERAAALRKLARDRGLAITIASPRAHDSPPTLLDNPVALRGGEGMVTFYKTPGYSMWDPSRAVFFGFAIFFGMIFSDAGYGLVLGILLLARWKRLGGSPEGVALRGVLLALVVAAIVYGVLIGSYFGVVPRPGTPLAALHVLDAEDQGLMMLISIGIGAAHLAIANLVNAWGRRRSATAIASVGWVLIILGGFSAGVARSYVAVAALFRPSLAAVALGALLVLVFTSEQPFGLSPKLLVGRLFDGLMGLAELSKAFGDVLSYLRLFALGLAAIKLAEAFNHLAAGAYAYKGVGVLLAILILVVGHTINFAMGIMGGVVHGLRLNVIEFFNWSLHEEGAPFRAFAKKARG